MADYIYKHHPDNSEKLGDDHEESALHFIEQQLYTSDTLRYETSILNGTIRSILHEHKITYGLACELIWRQSIDEQAYFEDFQWPFNRYLSKVNEDV